MTVAEKIVAHSAHLGRAYHCDLFRVGTAPTFAAIFVGGSGVTPQEHERRSREITPALDTVFARLSRELSFELLHVTAPADGLFGELSDERKLEHWSHHVAQELRSHLAPRPVYLSGHSGGAALALLASSEVADCVGAGALGADGLDEVVRAGVLDAGRWAEPLTLYYNVDDRVYDRNEDAIAEFVALKVAVCWREQSGAHGLGHYVRNHSVDGLIRRAARAAARLT